MENHKLNPAISALVNSARDRGTKIFLIDALTGAEISYGVFFDGAIDIGLRLNELGFSKGDKVLVTLPNSVELAQLYFGMLFSGVIAIPVNPSFSKNDIEFIAKHSKAKTIVQENNLSSFLEKPKLASPFDPGSQLNDSDIAAIVYTSGTTDRPKGVVHTYGSLYNNASRFINKMNIGEDNRFYATLSMSYMGGYFNLLWIPYLAGSSVILSKAFDAKLALNFWTPAIKHNANSLWFVPTILSILLDLDRGTEGVEFCRKGVKLSLVGTAPLPQTLRKKFETRYSVMLLENYGLTETLFISTQTREGLLNGSLTGNVGKPLDGVSIELKNDEGYSVSAGNDGEIMVTSSTLMAGYYSEASLEKNFFETGDIGRINEDGTLSITGRKKDLIIRGGINVSPSAIEQTILKHSDVSDVAVVGIPHAIYGEDIVAAVKVRERRQFDKTSRELFELCREELGSVRKPSHILEMEEIPKNPQGKTQKSKVRVFVLHKLNLSHSI